MTYLFCSVSTKTTRLSDCEKSILLETTGNIIFVIRQTKFFAFLSANLSLRRLVNTHSAVDNLQSVCTEQPDCFGKQLMFHVL